MAFRITKIPGRPIWHVRFRDRYSLAMTFLRLQEHYESPKFRGKVFDLEEFMDWYAKQRGGFTYVTDWTGFNVPSTSVMAVLRQFKDHSRKEQALFGELARRGILDLDRFYLIGTCEEKDDAVDHEICHGMFFCDPDYRAAVEGVFRGYRLRGCRRVLQRMGYCKAVLIDEMHAYALTGWPKGMTVSGEMRSLKRDLRQALKPFVR